MLEHLESILEEYSSDEGRDIDAILDAYHTSQEDN